MAILATIDTSFLVQGITGGFGGRHAQLSLDYGSQLVAGVTPGKGGQTFADTVPIFDSVAEAVAETGATASAIFVPPPFAPGPTITSSLQWGSRLTLASLGRSRCSRTSKIELPPKRKYAIYQKLC